MAEECRVPSRFKRKLVVTKGLKDRRGTFRTQQVHNPLDGPRHRENRPLSEILNGLPKLFMRSQCIRD